MQVLTLIGCGQMDNKTAGLMLYGLQTASCNLRNVKFEPERPTPGFESNFHQRPAVVRRRL
jgi:hypothetical protein